MEELLKSQRKKAGFTQKEVESELSLRSLTMKDYETGRIKLPAYMAIELANLYKISLNELLGFADKEEPQASNLNRFTSLFKTDKSHLIYSDPVIRGYLDIHHSELYSKSLFETLTKSISPKDKAILIEDLGKIICSLVSADSKISPLEIESLNHIVDLIGEKKSFKKIKLYLKEPYQLAENFEGSLEIRHFIIWCMFIFAGSDGDIVQEEIQYIDTIAEQLKLNRANYLLIKNKFIFEGY